MNNKVYIQYNKGDKRVTYMNFDFEYLLESSLPQSIEFEPDRRDEELNKVKEKFLAIGILVDRDKVEIAPSDGFIYENYFNEDDSSVLFRKLETPTVNDAHIESLIAQATNKLNEALDLKKSLESTIQGLNQDLQAKEELIAAQATKITELETTVKTSNEMVQEILNSSLNDTLSEEMAAEDGEAEEGPMEFSEDPDAEGEEEEIREEDPPMPGESEEVTE